MIDETAKTPAERRAEMEVFDSFPAPIRALCNEFGFDPVIKAAASVGPDAAAISKILEAERALEGPGQVDIPRQEP